MSALGHAVSFGLTLTGAGAAAGTIGVLCGLGMQTAARLLFVDTEQLSPWGNAGVITGLGTLVVGSFIYLTRSQERLQRTQERMHDDNRKEARDREESRDQLDQLRIAAMQKQVDALEALTRRIEALPGAVAAELLRQGFVSNRGT